jgi:solute carrier family 25 protein 14/30
LSDKELAKHECWKLKVFSKHLPFGAKNLSSEGLRSVLSALHLPESRIVEIFSRLDGDGDGWITFDEFSAFVDGYELELRTAFAAIDTDNSGSISVEEIQSLFDRMMMHVTPERRDELFQAMDADGDGQVTYKEFRQKFALLDPEDLLLSLDDSSSFGDLPTSMVADVFKKPASSATLNSAAIPGSAKAWALQLIPGGVAGVFAQSVVQPIETLKVRLQADSTPPKYKSMPHAFRLVVTDEGMAGLWKGMSPAALRELSYSTLRFGLYKPIKAALGAGTARDTPVWKMLAAGGAAAGIAGLVSNPTDLLKVRMQAEEGAARSMSAHAREVYVSSGRRVLGFWRGASTTVVRAVTLGAVKMATYDSSKAAVEDWAGFRQGTLANTLAASTITSANVIFWSAPVDFLRTRVMTGDGSAGMAQIVAQQVKANGPLVMWRGWLPQYMRLLPYGTLQFLFMEQLATALGVSMT